MLPHLPDLSEQAAKHKSRHLNLVEAHADVKALLAELREADLAGYDHKDASRREITKLLQPLIEAFTSEEAGSYSSSEIEAFEDAMSEFKKLSGKYLRRYRQQVAAGTFDNEMARTVLRMEHDVEMLNREIVRLKGVIFNVDVDPPTPRVPTASQPQT